MNPLQMNANRTARLVREAKTPTYSTSTPKAGSKSKVKCNCGSTYMDKGQTIHYAECDVIQVRLGWWG